MRKGKLMEKTEGVVMPIRRKAADPLARHRACIRTGAFVWDRVIIPPEPVLLVPRPTLVVLLVTR